MITVLEGSLNYNSSLCYWQGEDKPALGWGHGLIIISTYNYAITPACPKINAGVGSLPFKFGQGDISETNRNIMDVITCPWRDSRQSEQVIVLTGNMFCYIPAAAFINNRRYSYCTRGLSPQNMTPIFLKISILGILIMISSVFLHFAPNTCTNSSLSRIVHYNLIFISDHQELLWDKRTSW